MTFADWGIESWNRIRQDGLSGIYESGYELYLGALRRFGRAYTNARYPGESIFEKEWDVLIVLDGCRIDLLQEVEDQYVFLDEPATINSKGTTSIEWMQNNFTEENEGEMADTIYITGNPFIKDIRERNNFYLVDNQWAENWDSDRGTIHPNPITESAIHHHREHPEKRLLIHYMQPHYPFVPEAIAEGMSLEKFGDEGGKDTPWSLLRKDEVAYEEVWDAYRQNLLYVLNSVNTLLNNVSADEVILSADHGNALGEYGIYGHPANIPIQPLREVPWYSTSATDNKTMSPSVNPQYETENVDTETIENRLEDLGYV